MREKDKNYILRKKKEQAEHELQNGKELGYSGIKISDYLRSKIEEGKTKILISNEWNKGEIIQFRKRMDNGYWVNTNTKAHGGHILYLHREIIKQALGLTDEDIKDKEVHHIDGNKDNNNIKNLKLLTKEEHNKIHNTRSKDSHRHVCKKCGRTYWSSVSKSVDICDRCAPELATGGSSVIIIKKICAYCGVEYETKSVNRNKSRFCSNKCKSAWRRHSGKDNVEKICEYCGKKFITNKYSNTRYCSSKCAGKASSNKMC